MTQASCLASHQMAPVASHPGYHVTSDGRVWSDKRNRWLSTNKNSGGYLSCTLHQNGRHCTANVHQLVAAAWLPPAPSPEHVLDHEDRNPLNNHYNNLQWVTRAANRKNSHSVDTAAQTRAQVRDAQAKGWCICDVVNVFGLSRSTVQRYWQTSQHDNDQQAYLRAQVLALVAQKYTHVAIASQLGISCELVANLIYTA